VTVSRVMKVPIRVYNWVTRESIPPPHSHITYLTHAPKSPVSKPQLPYDLLAPTRKPDAGKVLDLGSAGGDGSSGDGNKEIDSKRSNGTSTSLSLIHGLGIRSDVSYLFQHPARWLYVPMASACSRRSPLRALRAYASRSLRRVCLRWYLHLRLPPCRLDLGRVWIHYARLRWSGKGRVMTMMR
jgi:hypothetical protein